MKLTELMHNLSGGPGLVRCLPGGVIDVDITGIAEDSRIVQPGDLFVARSGTADSGSRYISDALNAGAVAILTDQETASDPAHSVTVPVIVSDDVPLTAAWLAERLHGLPSRELTLIGITGTNGKTTTAHLVHQLLNKSGTRCGLIGTVEIDDGRTTSPATYTTPPAHLISRLLRQMVDAGCRACVMEVSSHALQQQRTAALDFNIAIFTNLTGDHLDYHGTVESYLRAKSMLFAQLGPDGLAIVNADDPAANAICRWSPNVATVSLKNESSDVFATITASDVTGSEVQLRRQAGPKSSKVRIGDQSMLHIPLIGRHNVSNTLQAIMAASACGVPLEKVVEFVPMLTAPPGRFERVVVDGCDFTVLVDYAHTDDALENALSALRPLVPADRKLLVLFGCGGDRDATKRPRMAAVAERFADAIVITSDNPRTEDPQAIVNQVVAGLSPAARKQARVIVDRRSAIERIVTDAEGGDVVLIAGKGHETYQILGRERVDFDDRLIAADAMQRRVQNLAGAMA